MNVGSIVAYAALFAVVAGLGYFVFRAIRRKDTQAVYRGRPVTVRRSPEGRAEPTDKGPKAG